VAFFCNTPLDSLRLAQAVCRARGARFVFWIQDLSGIAAERILRARLPVIGGPIGRHYIALERRIARRSDALVLITEDFAPLMARWGIARDRVTVIENWSPLDAIRPAPRDNAWAREHGLVGRLVILYTGMMGLKHNPSLVRDLAVRMKARPEVAVVVVSEGMGADWLAARKAEAGLDNLLLLAFQPFERMSEVLASADVLLAILESDAGVFSVPSKVLGYLSAGRAILASVPPENLAARILTRHEAGLTVAADDSASLAAAAERLIAEPGLRERLGQNGREYAKRTFDIDAITTRFEAGIARVTGGRAADSGDP
jgi:glycosyltransferase involved in cell wall biosynthesis